MNIFILSCDPLEAAKYHCDKHVVKMILESCQMLATAARRHDATEESLPRTKNSSPYKSTHASHPCTVWSGNTKSNYLWLHLLLTGLCDEYTKRYDKIHSCEQNLDRIAHCSKFIPSGELEPFPVAIAEDCNCRQLPHFDQLSTVQKYRSYYNLDKSYFAKWKHGAPSWFNPETE